MSVDADERKLEAELTATYAESFPAYARSCLKIRVKSGQTVPLKFNRSQQFLHQRIETQRKRTGRVRVLALKSRQVGISTYFTGRSYQKTTFNKGFRTFVLTQEDDTTTALFNMVKRFHENVPDFLRPVTGASNAKELEFTRMDSGYLVSTAGNKATGRGHTIQIFHGSETSRWPNAEEHVAGVLQSVPDVEGSEVYLESTANGVNNLFHTKWQAAVRGQGDFEAIFIPWFWHEEYEKRPSPDWRPSQEFVEYGRAHDLNREQLFWAHTKNDELGQGTGGKPDEICWLFKQEYPATAEEAFQTAGTNSFIRGDLVARARRRQTMGHGPIVLGVDVARGGADKSAIIDRQGRMLGGHVMKKFDYGKDLRPLCGDVVRTVREMRSAGNSIAKVIVDATGVGGGLYDMLREQLGESLVEGIEFGGHAYNRDRFANRRAEMWARMLEWFLLPAGVSMADAEELQADICAPAWGEPDKQKQGSGLMCRYRLDGALLMEEKDNIKKRLKFSPDFGDAAALTFAVDYGEYVAADTKWTPVTGQGAWML